jgi:hypothetical protein
MICIPSRVLAMLFALTKSALDALEVHARRVPASRSSDRHNERHRHWRTETRSLELPAAPARRRSGILPPTSAKPAPASEPAFFSTTLPRGASRSLAIVRGHTDARGLMSRFRKRACSLHPRGPKIDRSTAVHRFSHSCSASPNCIWPCKARELFNECIPAPFATRLPPR